MYTTLRNGAQREPLAPGTAFRRYARLGLDRRTLSVFEVYDVIKGMTPNASATPAESSPDSSPTAVETK